MKRTLLKIAGATLLAALLASVSFAGPINGNITFSGGAVLDKAGGAPTNDVNVAVKVDHWVNPIVSSDDGSFSSVAVGSAVTLANMWSFNSGAIPSFWSAGGFSFDLISSAIVSQGGGFLSVAGKGIAKGAGFTDSAGSWTFTSQNPAAGGAANPVFSFSAGSSVPDGGTTALLVGMTLVGMSFIARRRMSAKT
ncbi:MAG TPA: hypothetical protein VKC60_14665 [Opitutaceae bacterium]|nr:hypothetical protein [Opitutaceae bacterium]